MARKSNSGAGVITRIFEKGKWYFLKKGGLVATNRLAKEKIAELKEKAKKRRVGFRYRTRRVFAYGREYIAIYGKTVRKRK